MRRLARGGLVTGPSGDDSVLVPKPGQHETVISAGRVRALGLDVLGVLAPVPSVPPGPGSPPDDYDG